MPKDPWSGYGRFCPLARGLDVVGNRWTLVIVHELSRQPRRYTDLQRRLPGISSSVLSTRLRRLEGAGVVERQPGEVGQGVRYALTDLGRRLEEPLAALRQWGVHFLIDPTSDGADRQDFDVTYVEDIRDLSPGVFQLVVDDEASTLVFDGGRLTQEPGETANPEAVVATTRTFMGRWAEGESSWDDGRRTGEVTVEGTDEAWQRFQTATGYLPRYDPALAEAGRGD